MGGITSPWHTSREWSTRAQTQASRLNRHDTKGAIEKNKQIAENSKPRIAAMALYNCVVLSERRNDLNAAQRYLQQSLDKALLDQAQVMSRQLNVWNQ